MTAVWNAADTTFMGYVPPAFHGFNELASGEVLRSGPMWSGTSAPGGLKDE
jgi:hypothetical protein